VLSVALLGSDDLNVDLLKVWNAQLGENPSCPENRTIKPIKNQKKTEYLWPEKPVVKRSVNRHTVPQTILNKNSFFRIAHRLKRKVR
jgi:hypothetical protein